MKQTIAVIGGGQAGLQVLDSLKRENFSGQIYLICEENTLPYQRPPLSKNFLCGKLEKNKLFLRPDSFYEDIEVILNTRVELINRDGKIIHLNNQQTIKYDQLILTTGTCARRLPIPGADLSCVHYLRTLEDANKILKQLAEVNKIAIIGGGFIGLEVAAVMRQLDINVVIIEAQDRLLPRVVAPMVSEFYQDIHIKAGCDVYCKTQVSEIRECTNSQYNVVCTNGKSITTDLVIVGVGVTPNIELAETAGLQCNDGILVDEHTRTSDHNIFAAGDCSKHYNEHYDRYIRLESVQNAVDQAKITASTLLGKKDKYTKIPWFWSDQYDLKLQIAGLSHGYTEHIVRGEINKQGFSVFYFNEEELIAVDSINKPAEHFLMRRIIEKRPILKKTQIADTNFELKSLLNH